MLCMTYKYVYADFLHVSYPVLGVCDTYIYIYKCIIIGYVICACMSNQFVCVCFRNIYMSCMNIRVYLCYMCCVFIYTYLSR